jgi:hypothetical protein
MAWPSTTPSPIALLEGHSYTFAFTARLTWPDGGAAGTRLMDAIVAPDTGLGGDDFVSTPAPSITALPVRYSYTFTETAAGGDPAAAISFSLEPYGGALCISNVSFTGN